MIDEESRKRGGDRKRDIAPGRNGRNGVPYSCRFDSAGTLEDSALGCGGSPPLSGVQDIGSGDVLPCRVVAEGELPLFTSLAWPAVGTPTTAAC